MTKRLTLLTFAFLSITKLLAQQCDTAGYSKVYWFNGIQSSLASKILPGPNGTLLLFGNMQVDQNTPSPHYVIYISKLNNRGTPLQTKVLSYNTDVLLYDAAQSPDGNYFVTGLSSNGVTGSDPWLAKVDADGNTLWSFGLGKPVGAFFKVAPTADGGCVIGGRLAVNNTRDAHGNIVRAYNHAIVLRLDNTGKVVWGNEFYTSVEVEQVFEILQLHDGSTVVSGVKNNSPNSGPGSDYFMMKFDGKDGHTVWKKESPLYFGKITELANGNLLFRQSNFLYFVNAADGSVMSAISFFLPAAYNNNYDLHYAGSFADGEDLYYDFVDKKDILLFKMVNYDSIAWVSDLPANSSFGDADNPFSAIIQSNNGQGGIFLAGGITSQQLATNNTTFSEENSFLLKTNLSGWSPCTITLYVPITFSPVSLPPVADFSWAGSNTIGLSQPRPLVTSDKFAATGEKCYTNACCSDTTVYVTANICKGGAYTLPGGKVVTAPGQYAAVLPRKSGCDSVLFITVRIVPPSVPKLGNDTCFLHSPQITLNANALYADSYRWQDGSTDSVYTTSQTGTYIVQATNACGIFADTVTIFPTCDFPVFIPSAFTPNGDGRNDVFRILGLQGQQLEDFSIYNRWGQLVFRTKDPAKGWDGTLNGKMLATETFVYIIRYMSLGGIHKFARGTVSLIR
ncbi:MAG TPA: gliding motility-associated C-terminal domain-containing protein [Chitinophagaceae bacterium]|nr:gliding motility-associated C-terminal domain-containing protein [Chitinophagaceae bacterium]